MAAILCNGMNQACNRWCHKLGFWDEESCCHSCCGGTKYLSTLKHICNNPFGIFVTVTVVSNIPPMLIALTEVGNLHFDAGEPLCYSSVWLLINFLFCWVHIIASFYIAVTINHHHKHRRHVTADSKTIFKRAGNVFCFDPFMAAYIVTVGIYAAFLLLPKIIRFDRGDDNTCSQYIHEKVIVTVGFAWAFLGFGMGALALSFGFAFIDATRKHHRQGDKSISPPPATTDTEGFATPMSDLDSQLSYTTMEEGNQRLTSHSHSHSGSSNDNEQRLFSDEYIPPMIAMNANKDVVEFLSETEPESQAKSKPHTKKRFFPSKPLHHQNSATDYDTEGGNTSRADTVGFVTDLETDAEEPGKRPHGRRKKATNIPGHPLGQRNTSANPSLHFEEIDDVLPMSTYDAQEDTDTIYTTEGGEGITDSEHNTAEDNTDGENYPQPPSFETMDIDRALDLSDDDCAPVANLDIILEDPTISMSLTETDRSSTTGGGAESGRRSTTGSTGSQSGRSKGSKSSRSREPRNLTAEVGDAVQQVVDLGKMINDAGPSSSTSRNYQLLVGGKMPNLEYDPLSLTYSTSMGTLGAQEPLSFVDGGGTNNGGVGSMLPYANLREQSVLESSEGERTDPD